MSTLKKMRQNRGYTQKALAQAAGLSQSFIAELENGEKKPSFVTLEKLASALGVTVSTVAKLFTEPAEVTKG